MEKNIWSYSCHFYDFYLGNNVHFYKNLASGISASRDFVFPFCHGIHFTVDHESPSIADKKLETGTDICRGRAYRNDLVLFNGKYRTDLFTGIECRSHRFNRTGIYRNYSTHFLKRRRKTSTSIFHGVCDCPHWNFPD